MDNNICQTCLSKDRTLLPLTQINNLLQELKIEINDKTGSICWECLRNIKKFFKFKAQVQQAQHSLENKHQDIVCLSNLSTNTKYYYDYQFIHHIDPLTNDLDVKTDIKIEDTSCICDDNYNDKSKNNTRVVQDEEPAINEITLDVIEELINKDIPKTNDELAFENNENNLETNISDSETNIVPNAIYVETVKSKSKQRKQKKIKCNSTKDADSEKVNEEELKDKFYKVVYSGEELQKCREEKRNHPNFKKIPFKCDSCVLGFTKRENLDVHLEKKHNRNNAYTCDVCLSTYSHKRVLARHAATHRTRYRCALCAYEARSERSARSHCRGRHARDSRGCLRCPHCDAVATTQQELSEHIKTQHVVHCQQCGEKFKGKNTLRTHMTRIHGVKREFVCAICSRTFKTKSRLESHAASHSAALARRLAYCETCRVQYKNIYVYRNHLRTSANHSERTYPCPECNKKFVSKVYWKKHYNFYHLQKSKFNCELCNKMFISEWRLKVHNQTQHGLTRSRDHACLDCGNKFYTAATLRGHRLTHSAQRAFMCARCGDTFKQRPALYTHTRLVHRAAENDKH